MNNKKATTVSWAIVAVSIMVAGALAYLLFNAGVLEFIKSLFTDQAVCAMKKFFAIFSTLGLGGSAYCDPIYQTITLDKTGDDFVAINVPLSKNEKDNVKKWYKDKGYDFNDPTWYQGYRMDESVAEAYKSCFAYRNGRGRWPQGKKISWGIKDIISGKIIYCDACEIQWLDEDVKKVFGGKERRLDEYLKRHPVRIGSSESLWEYLRPKNVETDFRTITYPTDEDIAFVYVRLNPNKVTGIVLNALRIFPGYSKEDLPEVIDGVIIIPYKEYETLKCET